MKPRLKAVVFKTSRLKETMAFFTDQFGSVIHEFSPTHFVIYAKGIRIVFMYSEVEFEVELYFGTSAGKCSAILKDPNQIKIIIT